MTIRQHAVVESDAEHPVIAQLLDDVGGRNATWFLGLLDAVRAEGITGRLFNFNTTDVFVDFAADTATVTDVLGYEDGEAPALVSLGWLCDRVAESTIQPHTDGPGLPPDAP